MLEANVTGQVALAATSRSFSPDITYTPTEVAIIIDRAKGAVWSVGEVLRVYQGIVSRRWSMVTREEWTLAPMKFARTMIMSKFSSSCSARSSG